LYGAPLWAIPNSNCCVRIKCDGLNRSTLKKDIQNMFKGLGINVNIILCRYCQSKEDVLVKVETVFDKIEILQKYSQYPTAYSITDHETINQNIIDKSFHSFTKYSLGVSKYSSNTLSLGEVGKFPLSHKGIALSLAYWLRMEQGTSNILLNKAYNTMKSEGHQWLVNVYCMLCKIGMKDVWVNPGKWSIGGLKNHVRRRLNDMYLQKYHEYVFSAENSKKCCINKMCYEDQYRAKRYLDNVKTPYIRAVVTKLRIDANNTNDCKFRGFRYRSTISDECDECKVCENVEHVLFDCKKEILCKARSSFILNYSKYVSNFTKQSRHQHCKQILQVNPYCEDNVRENAIHEICKFLKAIYQSK
jgi:hypothetical protein